MRIEEHKKDLEWFDASGLDFDKRPGNNFTCSETKPIWVQYQVELANGATLELEGIGKFGLMTDMDTEETEEALTIFKGFDGEGWPYWDEVIVEYNGLEWCELEDVQKALYENRP